MKRPYLLEALVLVALVGLCVIDRLWIAHWPNATPVLSAALFAAFFMRRLWLAIAVPVLALLISDPIIGLYEPGAMIVNYLAMASAILFRPLIRRRFSAATIAGTTLGAAALFFVISNFGVWLFTPWYAKTGSGLVACYVAALPFFKYTLVGAVAWSAVFFGAWSLATRTRPTLFARPAIGLT